MNLSFYALGILALLCAIPLAIYHCFAIGYECDVRSSQRSIWWKGWFMDHYPYIYFALALIITLLFLAGYRLRETWPLP